MDEAVDIFLEAFQTEAVTRTWLDLSCPRLRRRYRHAVQLKLLLHLETGQPLPAVMAGEQVIGLASLQLPGQRIPLGRTLARMLPVLPHLVPLLPRFLRAAHLGAALRMPQGIPAGHCTLEMVAVHPDHQGVGAGRLLLRSVEQESRRHAASGIYLVTGNERNRQIYERASFRVVESRDARDFTAYHMFMDTSSNR